MMPQDPAQGMLWHGSCYDQRHRRKTLVPGAFACRDALNPPADVSHTATFCPAAQALAKLFFQRVAIGEDRRRLLLTRARVTYNGTGQAYNTAEPEGYAKGVNKDSPPAWRYDTAEGHR